MVIHIRPASYSDNEFYEKCLANDEFASMLYYDDEKWSFAEFLDDGKGIRIICSILQEDGKIEDVCFANFVNNGGDCFTIIGGLLPKYINSGLGILCATAAISFFFNSHPGCTLFSGVLYKNERSIRMTVSLGFKKIREQSRRHIFQLNEEDFHFNPLVKRILKSVKITIDTIHEHSTGIQ